MLPCMEARGDRVKKARCNLPKSRDIFKWPYLEVCVFICVYICVCVCVCVADEVDGVCTFVVYVLSLLSRLCVLCCYIQNVSYAVLYMHTLLYVYVCMCMHAATRA